MKLLQTIGLGECLSCGAQALDVAIYQDHDKKEIRCCRICAYKKPWLYGEYGNPTRAIMETIICAANVLRMDLRK